MTPAEAAALVASGLAAGAVNAIAGGGSPITCPTLIAVGLPPISANVSNALSVAPGYGASVLGRRTELAGQGRPAITVIPTVVLGALGGRALLLVTPRRVFDLVVPFLILPRRGAASVRSGYRAGAGAEDRQGAGSRTLGAAIGYPVQAPAVT